MRLRCKSILFVALAALLTVPPVSAEPGSGPPGNQPDFDGADMPPPPPRGQGREKQPGSWNQRGFGRGQESLNEPPRGDGFEGPGGRRETMRGRGAGQMGDGPRGNMGGGMSGGMGPLDLRPLNLTEEQKQKIQTTRQATAESVRQVRTNLKTVRGELKDMMFDPKASDSQIRNKRQEVRALQDKMDELLVNDFLKMRGVLTKEQLSHLQEAKPQPRSRAGFGNGGEGFNPRMQRQRQQGGPGYRPGFQPQGRDNSTEI
ncbi:MAG: Spy/CpxP family protein refolding chaperone [Candidatus Obscuribacterales bacterium]|nr:Spy/CpxP family protein refolding chaperone [Candidatus Obscuribacterales bacterium]